MSPFKNKEEQKKYLKEYTPKWRKKNRKRYNEYHRAFWRKERDELKRLREKEAKKNGRGNTNT